MSAPTRASIRPVVLALLGSGAGILPFFLSGTLAPSLQDAFDMGTGRFGLLMASFFITGAVLAPFGGRFADHYGWRAGSVTSSLITLCALALLGAAQNSLQLLTALVGAGIANAMAQPTGNLVIATEVHVSRRALMFGIKQTAVPLAGLIAGLSVPLISAPFGWRWVFYVTAVWPALTIAVAVRTPAGVQKGTVAAPHRPSDLIPQPVRLIMLGGLLAALTVSSLAAFAVVSSVAAGVRHEVAALALACGSALGIVLRVAAGWATDRRGDSGLQFARSMLLVGAVGLVCLSVGNGPLALVGTLISFSAGWAWGGLLLHGLVLRKPGAAGAVTGLLQTAISVGMGLGPVLFGVVADGLSHSAAWAALAVIATVAAFVLGRADGARLGHPVVPAED